MLLSHLLLVVACSRLLSSFQVEFGFKLKCLKVTFFPKLVGPVFIVRLREHYSDWRDVCKVVQLIYNDAH